jgi:hypothetical protein
MTFKNKNIRAFFAVIVFASFAISFTHAFLEQIENGCAQHENHDFASVIVNVVPVKPALEQNDFNFTKFSPVILTNILFYSSDIFKPLIFEYFNPPSAFSYNIYLTKFRSLTI